MRVNGLFEGRGLGAIASCINSDNDEIVLALIEFR